VTKNLKLVFCARLEGIGRDTYGSQQVLSPVEFRKLSPKEGATVRTLLVVGLATGLSVTLAVTAISRSAADADSEEAALFCGLRAAM
jgi:hypothetical protein